MRRFLMIIALMVATISSYGQQVDTVYGKLDINNMSGYNSNFVRYRATYSDVTGYSSNCHNFKGSWFSFKWGYNRLITSMSDFSTPSAISSLDQSIALSNFTLSFFNTEFDLVRNRLALCSSFDMEFNNFRFKDEGLLAYGESGIDPNKVKKSKLSTNYFNIPLNIAFYAGNVKISGGVVGGWCYNSHTKIKFKEKVDGKRKHKNNDISVIPFRFGYNMNIDFSSGLGFFCDYYPQGIFEHTSEPVRQISVGIRVSPGAW